MISDVLIPLLIGKFPGLGTGGKGGTEPCFIFPAKHPAVGDVQIFDDGDEITLVAGKFTHGHFSNYDDVSEEEKEKRIAGDVADFLEKLFSDQVILWGSHEGAGGWEVIEHGLPSRSRRRNECVWSGSLSN